VIALQQAVIHANGSAFDGARGVRRWRRWCVRGQGRQAEDSEKNEDASHDGEGMRIQNVNETGEACSTPERATTLRIAARVGRHWSLRLNGVSI
jgi:hypothetical protein